MTPRILVIAGSDSGGGAGIQADIKTVTMLGGHAMTAVTAITAQNTLGVQAVMPVPAAMVLAQIDACVADIGVDAIKIGMIGSAETAQAVAERLAGLRVPIVFDPVMVATSGDALADADTIAAFGRLMRLATLVTPNAPELSALVGRPLDSQADRQKAAKEIATRHQCAVLAKGGHLDPADTAPADSAGAMRLRPLAPAAALIADWLVMPPDEWHGWSAPRIDTASTHGTGCTLASAIATGLARGQRLPTAVEQSRVFVRLAIHDAPGFGGGHGPMGHQTVRLDLGPGARLNQLTLPMAPASERFYRLLGLTQIVDTPDGHYARFETAGGATLSVEQGARPTAFFECDDLDAQVARLQAAGLVFDHLPVDQDWRWCEARLTDPAGNAVCLYQAGEHRRYPPWRLPAA